MPTNSAEKLHLLTDQNGGKTYIFYCPGCKTHHGVEVPRWNWNKSLTAPTFSPSLLVNGPYPESRCHSFIKDGRIQYLGDCFHDLKNQTVEIPPFEATGW